MYVCPQNALKCRNICKWLCFVASFYHLFSKISLVFSNLFTQWWPPRGLKVCMTGRFRFARNYYKIVFKICRERPVCRSEKKRKTKKSPSFCAMFHVKRKGYSLKISICYAVRPVLRAKWSGIIPPNCGTRFAHRRYLPAYQSACS